MTGSEIVQRINKLLKEKKISKQQFYNDCVISSSAYSQWNTGKTFPTRANLLTVSEYLDTTVEYLLTGEETKKEPALNFESGSQVIQRIGKLLLECEDDVEFLKFTEEFFKNSIATRKKILSATPPSESDS